MFAIPWVGAWSLKTKFALCSGGLMFACSGVFTSWALHSVQADLIRSVTDAQKALVRTTADDIDEKLQSRTLALVKTAAALSATVDGKGALPGLDTFFKAQPVVRAMFDGIVIVDTGGRFLYDSESGSSRVGSRMTLRPYFHQVLAGAPSSMSRPFWTAANGHRLLLVLAAPLHTADGRVCGALMGSIDLLRPNFLGRLHEARIGQAGRYTLIEKGPPPIIVMHHDTHRILTALDPSNDPKLARALAGFEGTLQGIAGGVEALRTSVSLRAAPWILVAVYPTAEAFADVRIREQEILWVAGVLCLAASCIAWLTAGWMLQPLKRLQTVLASQGSDRGTPISLASFGSIELATLVEAYNAQAVRRREFEDRLKASERHMRAITDNLPVLISYIDRAERYRFLNATFKTWLDLEPSATLGLTLREVMSAHEYAAHREHIQRCLAGERVSFDLRSDMRGGSRNLHTVYVPDRAADGEVAGFYTMTTDVTALKNVERQLALLVRADSLTGLANRYQFNEALPQALSRCARSGLAMALLFLDIDHFKQINDRLGHAAGDAVLQELAARLQRCVRSTDLAARLGGDEFVIVLEGLHSDSEAQQVARNLLADIARPFAIGGRSLTVTTSVGIAYQVTADCTAPELLALADAALYRAKADGRNTYHLAAARGSEASRRSVLPRRPVAQKV